jgi:hypothetical protein
MSVLIQNIPNAVNEFCIATENVGNDVSCSEENVNDGFDFFVFVDEFGSTFIDFFGEQFAFDNFEGERFQPVFACQCGGILPLRFERQIDVFEPFDRLCFADTLVEFGRKFSGGLDGFEDCLLSLAKDSGGTEFLVDLPQSLFVEILGNFFAVSRNEGDRKACIEEIDDGLNLFLGKSDILGKMPNVDRNRFDHKNYTGITLDPKITTTPSYIKKRMVSSIASDHTIRLQVCIKLLFEVEQAELFGRVVPG